VPVDQQALTSTLQSLLTTMDLPLDADAQVLAEHLDRVMDAAQPVLQVDGVGLMLADDSGRLRVIGTSNEAGTALERGQQELGLGPAVDCVRAATTIRVDDLADRADYADLWRWLQQHYDSGVPVRAVLSAPVRVRGRVAGTLNALCAAAEPWSDDHAQAVEAYAGILGVLLRLAAPSSGTIAEEGR
jgi:GAF domain-containing protein